MGHICTVNAGFRQSRIGSRDKQSSDQTRRKYPKMFLLRMGPSKYRIWHTYPADHPLARSDFLALAYRWVPVKWSDSEWEPLKKGARRCSSCIP
jgi:hypothetical protein